MKLSKSIKKAIATALACLISGIGMPVSLVFALPQDGNIVGGQGTINQPTAQDLVINQNTSNLIINWQGFNIGAAESVQFIQPGVDSVALNRVVGADPSRIAGRLSANGQVFITNPSGVIFLPGSQVNVHGLLATTLGISDQDFLDRNYRFFQDPSANLASILNQGTINANYVGLLAPSVVNQNKIIVASLGSVALASGKAATLDFIGDDLIHFTITEEVEGTGTDAAGNVLEHNISNEGLIRADGGIVSLSVRRAGEIVKSVINQEGIIEARSVVNKEGRIFLSGGDNGIVRVTGTLDASGKGAGEKGGAIHVTGENVGLFDNAVVDASGDTGGGEILIGGDRLGEGELQNAKATFVGENVSIDASAITEGNAGKLVVFAEDVARIYGDLSARGGSVSGNGGFIETSGKQYFEVFKAPDIGAPNGLGGEWLIDPFDLEIVQGNVLNNINNSNPFSAFGRVAQLGVGLIRQALGLGNVTVNTGSSGAEAGNIIWNADLDFNGIGANRTLFVNAAGDVIFNNSIFDSVAPGVGESLNLTITSQNGILQFNNGAELNGGGNFFLRGNDIEINSGAQLTGGIFNILTTLASTSVGLGSGPGSFSLTDAELNRISAQQINIGSGTQEITVAAVSISDSLALFGDVVTFTGEISEFGILNVIANDEIHVFQNTASQETNILQDTGGIVADRINFFAVNDINIETGIETTGVGQGNFILAGNNMNFINANINTQGPLILTSPSISFNAADFNSSNNSVVVLTDGLTSPNNFQFSSINAGTAGVTLAPFTPGNGLALGGSTGPDITQLLGLNSPLDGRAFLTASQLTLGLANTGPVTVNDVIIDFIPVTINSSSSVSFNGPSLFADLTVNAFDDINVNADVGVISGDFQATADFEQNGVGDFNFPSGNTIAVAQNAAIAAVNIFAGGTFNVGGTLSFNTGETLPPQPPPTTEPELPPVTPPLPLIIVEDLEGQQQQDQGNNSFATNLLDNAKPPGC